MAETTQPPARRAFSLDALRGLAILAMCLSGVVPWMGLPNWMYHAQFPRVIDGEIVERVTFVNTFAGYTWVDLVFPAFLFSMGVAFPFALRKRLDGGTPLWRILTQIAWRYVVLVWFAIYVRHITPYVIARPDPTDTASWLLGLLGFLLLFPALTRFPKQWPDWVGWTLRISGVLLANVFLFWLNWRKLEEGPESIATFLRSIVGQSDIILLVLANMAFFGSLIWVLTRNQPWGRLGFFVVALAGHGIHAKWHQAEGMGWLGELAWSPVGWAYNFSFLKYLFIVLPGTIIGDWLLAWMSGGKSETGELISWPKERLWGIVAALAALVVFFHVALQARWQMAASTVGVLALVGAVALFQKATTSTEQLLRRFYVFGAGWMILGVLLDWTEGGIKKDPSTLSYYFVSLGLAIFLLIFFLILIDILQYRRTFWLLVANGQNPMLAYVGIRNLLAPVVNLLGLESFFMNTVFQSGWGRFIWSMMKTVGLGVVVAGFTRIKVIWRS